MSNIIEMRIPRTLIGLGSINNIGEVLKDLPSSRILIVTDPGIKQAGILETARLAVEKAGYKCDVYAECETNCAVSSVERLGKKILTGKYDLLIGIGGGSVLDSTKLASHLGAVEGINIYDMLEGKAINKSLAKILIPTTAGTGSEWSLVAMVSDEKAGGQKKAVTTTLNVPNAVILDPELTRNLPARVTADTGLDALVHAIEGYTASNANVVSDMFALTALQMISDSLAQAYCKGKDNMTARYNMSIAASLAMYACAMSGVGIAHFMGHSLERRFHLSHGTACTFMLPFVMEFHLLANPQKFARIAEVMGEATTGLSTFEAAAKSVDAVRRLSGELGIPRSLGNLLSDKSQIADMAEETLHHYGAEIRWWNPRDPSKEDLMKVFAAAFS
jgi:alcohol dehydrogenase class IV